MKPSRLSGLVSMQSVCSLVVVSLLAACHPAPPPDAAEPKERDGLIITREDIEKSGAKDGWEALRRGATHLNFQYARDGSPARVTHRGVDSFFLSLQMKTSMIFNSGSSMPP